LKQTGRVIGFVDGLVLSLPMRNWNPNTWLLMGFTHVTFWVYLWGIETWCWLLTENQHIDCFESTYEELKHIFQDIFRPAACQFWVYLWGIETTYQDNIFGKTLESFESTYEELKLSSL